MWGGSGGSSSSTKDALSSSNSIAKSIKIAGKSGVLDVTRNAAPAPVCMDNDHNNNDGYDDNDDPHKHHSEKTIEWRKAQCKRFLPSWWWRYVVLTTTDEGKEKDKEKEKESSTVTTSENILSNPDFNSNSNSDSSNNSNISNDPTRLGRERGPLKGPLVPVPQLPLLLVSTAGLPIFPDHDHDPGPDPGRPNPKSISSALQSSIKRLSAGFISLKEYREEPEITGVHPSAVPYHHASLRMVLSVAASFGGVPLCQVPTGVDGLYGVVLLAGAVSCLHLPLTSPSESESMYDNNNNTNNNTTDMNSYSLHQGRGPGPRFSKDSSSSSAGYDDYSNSTGTGTGIYSESERGNSMSSTKGMMSPAGTRTIRTNKMNSISISNTTTTTTGSSFSPPRRHDSNSMSSPSPMGSRTSSTSNSGSGSGSGKEHYKMQWMPLYAGTYVRLGLGQV